MLPPMREHFGPHELGGAGPPVSTGQHSDLRQPVYLLLLADEGLREK